VLVDSVISSVNAWLALVAELSVPVTFTTARRLSDRENLAALGVVIPTVPLMLIEAVPVRFVTVPDEGVPSAPPLVTKAPEDPTFTAKAVATPVPKPEIPVETGSPVQFVSVPEVGVPRTGVTRVGLVANTSDPLPVSSETAAIRFAEEGVAKNVATPVPRPEIPVETGNPVQFVSVPEVGVPRRGVTRVGLVANTSDPVPVSSETAAIRFAEEGVAKNVATPVPRPEIPVETGNPVQFVSVPEVGVPRTGVTSVGLVAKTLLPVPVLVTLATFLFASSASAVLAVSEDTERFPTCRFSSTL